MPIEAHNTCARLHLKVCPLLVRIVIEPVLITDLLSVGIIDPDAPHELILRCSVHLDLLRDFRCIKWYVVHLESAAFRSLEHWARLAIREYELYTP